MKGTWVFWYSIPLSFPQNFSAPIEPQLFGTSTSYLVAQRKTTEEELHFESYFFKENENSEYLRLACLNISFLFNLCPGKFKF